MKSVFDVDIYFSAFTSIHTKLKLRLSLIVLIIITQEHEHHDSCNCNNICPMREEGINLLLKMQYQIYSYIWVYKFGILHF